MTVNEALIVCAILKKHGHGDKELTNEAGYCEFSCYPNSVKEHSINMEGYISSIDGEWVCGTCKDLCEEIKSALEKECEGNG